MGIPETAISHTIFVIAAILISVSLVAVFASVVNDFSHSIEDKSNRLSREIRTDIQIINDPTAVPYLNGNLTIYVKNTGRTTIENDSVVVLIDGGSANITSFITPNGVRWYTGITANISVHAPDIELKGDHSLKVIVMHGTSDSIIFRIHSLSAIKFVNDPLQVPYTHPMLTLYLLNTGERGLDTGLLQLMVDGEYRSIESVFVIGGDWDPGEIARFNVTAELRQDRTHNARAECGEASATLSGFRIWPRFSFDITNDPEAVPYNNSNLTFYLHNTGNETISPTTLRVLVNGPMKEIVVYKVIGGGEWVPESTLNLTVKAEGLNSTELHRVRVNGSQGSTSTMEFYVKEE